MKWIREHGIEVIKWPGNSPDLNPIENLWSIFKGKLYSTKQKGPPPPPLAIREELIGQAIVG